MRKRYSSMLFLNISLNPFTIVLFETMLIASIIKKQEYEFISTNILFLEFSIVLSCFIRTLRRAHL